MNISWFYRKESLDQEQLEKLGELLRTQVRTQTSSTLPSQKKDRIRAHLFERIDAMSSLQQELPLGAQVQPGDDETESYLIDRLISWMRDAARSVQIDPVRRAVMRERLYALPDRVVFHSVFFRRAMATVSLSSMLGLALFAFALKVPVTFAKEITVIHDVEGSVNVVRDGKQLPVTKGLELHEGDTLVTGSDGKAVITYFDKSITRFFENTNVSFDSLRSENFGFDHVVSLNLAQGRVWSNVIDYVVNSEFKVTAHDFIASASKRATFSLSSEQNQASLQVFHNLVNVEIPSKLEQKTVVKGFQVVTQAKLAQQVVEPIHFKGDEKQWVATNLAKDQQVLGEVEKDNKGVIAGPLGGLQEKASLMLAFNDDERFRLELNIAEKSFYETIKKDGVSADEVKNAFDSLQAVALRSTPSSSDDAKKLASATLQSARNELLSAQPDSRFYDVKVSLQDKDFAVVSDDKKLAMALDQASQFIAEAQDLQDKGLKDVAAKAIEKYQDRIKTIDALVAGSNVKRIVLDDATVSKRQGLDKLYVAFKNPSPVIPVVVAPTVAVTGSVAATTPSTSTTAVRPDTTPTTTATSMMVRDARSDTTTSTHEKADVKSGETAKVDGAPAVQDDTRLPPKLQLSRD